MSSGPDEAVHQAGHGEIVIAAVNRVLRYHDTCQSGDYGILCVTNYRIVFVSADCSELPPISPRLTDNGYDMPLTSVRKLYAAVRNPGNSSVFGRTKVQLTTGVKVAHLEFIEIACKDFNVHRFGVPFADRNSLKKLITTLLHHCFPVSQPCLFAFDYRPSIESEQPKTEFSLSEIRARRQQTLESEMTRCKIDVSGLWTIAQNLQFAICDSYPALVVIPSAVSDEVLVKCKTAWESARFPIWSWSSTLTKSWLVRSARQQAETEEATAFKRGLVGSGGPEMMVVDASPYAAAKVQSSYEKLLEVCYHERSAEQDKLLEIDNSWMALFEETRWPRLVSSTLKLAADAAALIMDGMNVVVEGNCPSHSECLVTSLIMLILDPFYRTRAGLHVLIEKEWASAGFRFLDSHLQQSGKKGHNAIFLLFLDCLHQLMVQFPLSFEYTEVFLIHLWGTVLSSLYGDFVFNCDKERVPPEYTNTNSFWHHDGQFDPADRANNQHQNVAYLQNATALRPKTSGMDFRPWITMFYPTLAGVFAVEEQRFRSQVCQKLDRHDALLKRRDALLEKVKAGLPTYEAAAEKLAAAAPAASGADSAAAAPPAVAEVAPTAAAAMMATVDASADAAPVADAAPAAESPGTSAV